MSDDLLGGNVFVTISGNTMKGNIYNQYVKNIFDFSVALLALFIIWPLLLLVYLHLRFSIGTPVLFKQKRPGFMGRIFTIYKFRTMTNEYDSSGRLLPDEDRITRVGQLLRSLSLDELPELFNVLKGDMSLVGPRPLMVQYLEHYNPEQARRHEVMPGITGWAQIHGRADLAWEEKFKLDLWYVDHQSFTLDIAIITKTFWKVCRRTGISREGYVTGPEFMGSPPETMRPDSETEEKVTKS
jgi:sugar transferase EpsL